MTSESKKQRINGRLHLVTSIKAKTGDIIHHMVQPLMLEMNRKDFYQIILGATILAIPTCYSAEVWELSETLPLSNIFILLILSLSILSGFIYANFYRGHLREHQFDFVKRILVTYLLTVLIVAFLLWCLMKLPLLTDPVLSFKRMVLICLPASMSASLSDALK